MKENERKRRQKDTHCSQLPTFCLITRAPFSTSCFDVNPKKKERMRKEKGVKWRGGKRVGVGMGKHARVTVVSIVASWDDYRLQYEI